MGPDAAGLAAPVIEAHWEGFVDLQRQSERAGDLPEAAQVPALAVALARLNAADSPVWTSKCAYWPHLEAGEFDPYELDAPPGYAAHAMGCFIDLLPKSEQQWTLPDLAEKACKRICGLLRVVPLRCCRVDLVIRHAIITPEIMDLGVTAYLTACGESASEAGCVLDEALAAFAGVVKGQSSLEWESVGE